MEDVRFVFFDADDTLIELSKSLGELYAEVCAAHGLCLSADEINSRVVPTWNSIRLEYRNEEGGYVTSPEREKAMWLKFIGLLLDDLCRDCSRESLYEAIYREFGFARSRRLKPDVLPLIDVLSERGASLGVLSNNDERIRTVLEEMDLAKHFDYIIPTAEIGYKKPSPKCFDRVRTLVGGQPHEMLYIGDNPETDYQGARAAGWHALCFNERGHDYAIDRSHLFNSYSELIERFSRSR